MPHKIPNDLYNILVANPGVFKIWNSLTPLAQNEWICWVISVKKDKTKKAHIKRVVAELKEGKRRPCCWIGCIHRTDKKISPSVLHLINRNNN